MKEVCYKKRIYISGSIDNLGYNRNCRGSDNTCIAFKIRKDADRRRLEKDLF